QFAEKLMAAFAELGGKYNKPDIAHIGIVPFNPVDTTENILLSTKEAYEQAQLIGANSYYVRVGNDTAIGIAEWKTLVFNIIDKQTYNIQFINKIENFQSQKVLMEEAFTQVVDNQGNRLPIGTFISIAEKFEKIVELDKGVISKVIDYIETKNINYLIAINVATRTIKNSDFRAWLSRLVKQKQRLSQQLVFNLSAYAVAKDINSYKEFIAFAQQLNLRVMIKRFETQSLSAESIKQLKPDFIRLARDLGLGIANDVEKKEFVEAMKDIGELLNITILAENIDSEDDFVCLKKVGITGASR
ncbi:MAG: EAL domain-containing protein, partial [Methylococcales bacterium]